MSVIAAARLAAGLLAAAVTLASAASSTLAVPQQDTSDEPTTDTTVDAAEPATAPDDATSAAEDGPLVDPDTVDPDTVELVDQTPWAEPGGIFAATLSPGGLPDDASVSVDVMQPLTTRHELQQTLSGDHTPTPLTQPFNQLVGEIPRNSDGHLAVSFEPSGPDFSAGGVYPVELRGQSAEGELLAHLRTYLLLLPEADFPPLPLALVLETGAPPAQQPDGDVSFAPGQLDAIQARVDLLEATEQSLSLAPVPETLDSLQRYDVEGLELVGDLSDSAQGHQVLARPYVDLDLDQWASAAGLVAEAPREAEAGADVLRNVFGVEPEPNIWLADTEVGAAEAATWQDLGVTHALLPGAAVEDIDAPPQSVTPLLQLPDGPPAYASDDVLVERLLDATDTVSQQHALAELGMIWFEQPGNPRPVTLRIPPEATLDGPAVAETLDHAADAGAISVVTATELFDRYGPAEDREPVAVTLAAAPEGDSLAWMPARVAAARATLAGVASTFSNSAEMLTSFERALLIAPGSEVLPRARRAYFDAIDNAAEDLAAGIGVPDTFRITLTDRDGVIPVTITNDHEVDVSLRIELSSNQLEFRDGEHMDVTVPPGSTRIDVPVQTRTSGAFPLHITLTSPDGEMMLDETTFDIRSTAISGVGLVLSVGAGAFLVIWWFRHWRRSRREQATEPIH